jgi:hypothetical protein
MTLIPVRKDAYIESRFTWSRLAVPHDESIIFFHYKLIASENGNLAGNLPRNFNNQIFPIASSCAANCALPHKMIRFVNHARCACPGIFCCLHRTTKEGLLSNTRCGAEPPFYGDGRNIGICSSARSNGSAEICGSPVKGKSKARPSSSESATSAASDAVMRI